MFNFCNSPIHHVTATDATPKSPSEPPTSPPSSPNKGKTPSSASTVSADEPVVPPLSDDKSENDTNNNQDESLHLKPPTSLINCSPYDFQLLSKLVPRHITIEHVIYSHKTKVNGRSLYFFSPACRGAPSKPVFTMREKLTTLIDTYLNEEEECDSPTHVSGRISTAGGVSAVRRRREEAAISGVCTLKRVHLFDPACDIGVSVWRGRGPQTGVRGPQKPPSGTGPALLLESKEESGGDGMAVAAGFSGEVMFLVPLPTIGKSDFEPRATEIFVHDAVLTCISESVVWFMVKSFTRRKLTASRNISNQRITIGKFKKGNL